MVPGPPTAHQLDTKATLCSFVLFVPISNRALHQPDFAWQSCHAVIKNTFLSLTLLSAKLFYILPFTLSWSTGFTFVHLTSNFLYVCLSMLVSWRFMRYLVLFLSWKIFIFDKHVFHFFPNGFEHIHQGRPTGGFCQVVPEGLLEQDLSIYLVL